MYKAIDVWKKLDNITAIRYRCFQRLSDHQFCVQSADYYRLPIQDQQVQFLERQFLELFIEETPDQRSSLHATLEEAIAAYDHEFETETAVVPLH